MMVAMASDIRVILIKLADRLHNMRTIDAMPKNKQQEKARETLEIFAPLAHRLGIHAIKWELEDLAFATLHPRKFKEIKGLVNQQREEREGYVSRAGEYLAKELEAVGIDGRDQRAREALLLDLLEDDQEGPRVQRDLRPHGHARAGGLGEGLLRRHRRDPLAVEAAARPLQGLRGDAQVQHVPGAAHHGDRARGQAAGDPDPHPGDARHRRVRHRRALDLQGRQRRQAGRPRGVAAAPRGLAEGDAGPAGVRRDAEGGPVRGRGVRVHAEGRGEVALRRRHPARLRLLDPHRRRPPLRGREGERQDRAAALRAAVGRHLRGAHLQEGARVPAATGWRWRRPPARSRRSAPGSSARAARTPSAPAARSSRRACAARAFRRRRSPARRCWPT